jgi:hypothetical protein
MAIIWEEAKSQLLEATRSLVVLTSEQKEGAKGLLNPKNLGLVRD